MVACLFPATETDGPMAARCPNVKAPKISSDPLTAAASAMQRAREARSELGIPSRNDGLRWVAIRRPISTGCTARSQPPAAGLLRLPSPPPSRPKTRSQPVPNAFAATGSGQCRAEHARLGQQRVAAVQLSLDGSRTDSRDLCSSAFQRTEKSGCGSEPREPRGGSTRPDVVSLERSEERRVGKECRTVCRSRWSPYH